MRGCMLGMSVRFATCIYSSAFFSVTMSPSDSLFSSCWLAVIAAAATGASSFCPSVASDDVTAGSSVLLLSVLAASATADPEASV
jgi:hypothetical protein